MAPGHVLVCDVCALYVTLRILCVVRSYALVLQRVCVCDIRAEIHPWGHPRAKHFKVKEPNIAHTKRGLLLRQQKRGGRDERSVQKDPSSLSHKLSYRGLLALAPVSGPTKNLLHCGSLMLLFSTCTFSGAEPITNLISRVAAAAPLCINSSSPLLVHHGTAAREEHNTETTTLRFGVLCVCRNMPQPPPPAQTS